MAEQDTVNSINNSIVDNIRAATMSTDEAIKTISTDLKLIIGADGLIISQSSLQDLANAVRYDSTRFRDNTNQRDVFAERRQASQNRTNQSRPGSTAHRSDYDDLFSSRYGNRFNGRHFWESASNALESEFKRSIYGSVHPVRDVLSRSVDGLAKRLGVSVNDLGRTVGSRFGKLAGDWFKGTRLGGSIANSLREANTRFTTGLQQVIDGVGDILETPEDRQRRRQQMQSQPFPTSDQVASTTSTNPDIDEVSHVIEQATLNSANVANATMDAARQVMNDSADIANDTVARSADIAEHNIQSVSSTAREAVEDSAEALSNSADAVNKAANGGNNSGTDELTNPAGVVRDVLDQGMSEVASSLASGAGGMASIKAGLGTMASAITAVNPALLGLGIASGLAIKAITGIIGVVKKLIKWGIEPIKKGISDLISTFASSTTRVESQNSKYLTLWRDRVKKDIEDIRKLSFSVIEESAQRIEDVWDNILTTVSATQGYDKAGVQDLWSRYADKLTKLGLSSTVSSADIMENLKSVLESGLSGKVAEEFALIATILKNAIPTQDFFQYASTYASIAANAMKNGASESEAIVTANQELRSFASNLLYAGRYIAGGFTTSLTNGSSLFEQSAKIALTSRTGDVSDISGVLTSVSAIVGAIAPDLADSLVTAVTNAAIGGNASEITALRSMAGTGASNTAFLQALATNPKEVFETLFRNLAQLQNMSAANYMEVAEGLSQVFGLSMDAFARVDFDYLADAIHEMALTDDSLNENLQLLISGETTSTASQLRMQKINEYMIEEGLAYVLDNEAARVVQQHMWEEQLAREITNSTFAVEVTGQAIESLQSVVTGVKRLSSLFSGNLIGTAIESFKLTLLEQAEQEKEIAEIVQAGVVGKGQDKEYLQLTTGGENLNLTKTYLDYLTGSNQYTRRYDIINEKLAALYASGSTYDMIFGKVASNPVIYKAAMGVVGAQLEKEYFRKGTYFGDDASDAVSKSQAATSATQSSVAYPKSLYNQHRLVSKTTASAARSGDYRTDVGYNPIWDQTQTSTVAAQSGTSLASELVTSIQTFNDASDSIRQNLVGTQKSSAVDLTSNIISTESALHRDFYDQNELLQQVLQEQANATDTSFEAWKKSYEKAWNDKHVVDYFSAGHMITQEEAARVYKSLEEILADYGTDISVLERLFDEEQVARTNASTKARELHEVQFWEDMQNFATKDFPWYMREWERYYIQHEAYGTATAGAYDTPDQTGDSKGIGSLIMASQQGEGDAILALAQVLTDNATYQNKSLEQLKDPTLQTNAILSKILLVIEAIYQQNNETSIVSVPTSLSSLGLGVTNM